MNKTAKQFTKWTETEAKASKMDSVALAYSIGDCLATAGMGLDESYYRDEATVYMRELTRRNISLDSAFVHYYVNSARNAAR